MGGNVCLELKGEACDQKQTFEGRKKMLPDIFFTVHKLLSYALLLPRQNQFVCFHFTDEDTEREKGY